MSFDAKERSFDNRLELRKIRSVHYNVSNARNKVCCGPKLIRAIYFYTGLDILGAKFGLEFIDKKNYDIKVVP